MTKEIKCEYTNCDSDGWDSYMVNGKLELECVTCGGDIKGNFEIGADGWVHRVAKAGV
jgi:hypothetical protein